MNRRRSTSAVLVAVVAAILLAACGDNTVLSLPFVLERLVPEIAAAVVRE